MFLRSVLRSYTSPLSGQLLVIALQSGIFVPTRALTQCTIEL